MSLQGLFCQVCLEDCPSIFCFKEHLRADVHQRKKAELFQKKAELIQQKIPRSPRVPAYFPNIYNKTDAILGLSLVTLCLDSENGSLFYLCHVCEASLRHHLEMRVHLNSTVHCSNYYNYTDPDVLRFSWIPSPNIHTTVDTLAHSNVKKNCELSGKLQALDLPPDLFERVKDTSYVKVMHTLGQNDNLLKQITALRPKKTTIQTYLGTPNRKHPLLGLEHLVECSCDEQTDRRLYLCTICKITVTDHRIISHLLCFRHIHGYINAWHPSTLMMYSCYGYDMMMYSRYGYDMMMYSRYDNMFQDMMQDFAKQMEEIHGTTITDMKQVLLRPVLFSAVEGTSYVDALAKLEHWRKLRKESSLITSITPGDKLVTIKQEVIQEDHTHSCFSGHTEMRKALKHGLDYVSLNEDGETVKQRRISHSPDGGGTCDGPSNVSSPASQCPSPQRQVARVKVETTSVPTTLLSQVPHCESSQMQRENVLELNLECPPTNPASTQPSTTPWFIDSSLIKREPQSGCPSPQHQDVGVKVESTSAPTALVSQVPLCEPSQMRPRPKLEQILNSLKILASSNFNLECSPTKPVSGASTEPSTTPWFIDSSLANREPELELHSTLSKVKQASPPLPKLTAVAAVPLSPAANKDLPSSEPITSIVDMNDLRHFTSLVRAEQSGKDVSPSRASPENAIEIVTMTSTSTQTSVGRVKPRMQLDSKCRIQITKPNQSANVLKRKLAQPKPADDDIWDYENRQFTPESRATDVNDVDDQSMENYYRAANPAGEDGRVSSNPPAARAVSSTELQPWGDQAIQFSCNLGTTPATVVNPNNTAQVMQASEYPPFNIGVGPYMGSPVTVVNPNPTRQQFTGSDYSINQPTLTTVSSSGSLPAAGYGTPVYPYGQVTQNFYFPHGYPYGTGHAGESRAPEQHPVFSQYVNYSDGSAGGLYPMHTPEAWLDLQRQQQPQ